MPADPVVPRVVNKRYASRYERRRAVYVGRPTKWGNPHHMPSESARDAACDGYETYIATRLINGAVTAEDFTELEGKNLMCWCSPRRCHADTLLKLAAMSHEQRMEWADAKLSGVHG